MGIFSYQRYRDPPLTLEHPLLGKVVDVTNGPPFGWKLIPADREARLRLKRAGLPHRAAFVVEWEDHAILEEALVPEELADEAREIVSDTDSN